VVVEGEICLQPPLSGVRLGHAQLPSRVVGRGVERSGGGPVRGCAGAANPALLAMTPAERVRSRSRVGVASNIRIKVEDSMSAAWAVVRCLRRVVPALVFPGEPLIRLGARGVCGALYPHPEGRRLPDVGRWATGPPCTLPAAGHSRRPRIVRLHAACGF